MITRKLKNYEWVYDEEVKQLRLFYFPTGISEALSFELPISKVFSLDRFLVRVYQKLSSKRRVSIK